MKEPKRLFESGSPLERTILGFGRDESPSDEVSKKTLAAMAVVPAATVAETPATSRWVRPAAIAGAAALGIGALLMVVVSGRSDSTSTSSSTTSPVPTTAAPVTEPSPTAATAESVVTPDTLPNAPQAPQASSSVERRAPIALPAPQPIPSTKLESGNASVAREVELLDAVKAKLAASDPSSAARSLDTYDSEFPQGTLRPEATVLRIRTLLARGDRATAEKLGGEFLSTHPTGVHAKRIRALLGEENESGK